MHVVDMVTNEIDEENFYYFMYKAIIRKVRSDQKLLITMTRGFISQLDSGTHHYIKNEVILPYQRILGILIYTLNNGNIERLSLEDLSFQLSINEDKLMNILRKNCENVLLCIYKFSQTYVRRSYFDNYLSLYIRTGSKCINYDYLFVKIVTVIMHKKGISI